MCSSMAAGPYTSCLRDPESNRHRGPTHATAATAAAAASDTVCLHACRTPHTLPQRLCVVCPHAGEEHRIARTQYDFQCAHASKQRVLHKVWGAYVDPRPASCAGSSSSSSGEFDLNIP
jgi:hypothetical protein